MLRVDIGVKISHNVDVLQSTEEGNFKSSGAAVDQLLRKLLLKADVSVRLSAHKGDPGYNEKESSTNIDHERKCVSGGLVIYTFVTDISKVNIKLL